MCKPVSFITQGFIPFEWSIRNAHKRLSYECYMVLLFAVQGLVPVGWLSGNAHKGLSYGRFQISLG